MKKKIISVLAIILLLSLTGFSDYKESNGRYIVSALGFKDNGSTVTALAQILTVNESSADEQVVSRVFTGEGKSCKEAVSKLSKTLTKPVVFDHCNVILCNTAIKKKRLYEVLSFVRSDKSVNLAIYVALCENPAEILSTGSDFSAASGFDLVRIEDNLKDETGLTFDNRYYKIEKAQNRITQDFSLPVFEIKDNSIALSSLTAFSKGAKRLNISSDRGIYLSILKNGFSGGRINGTETTVNKCHTTCSFKEQNGRLKVNIKSYITVENTDESFIKDIKNGVKDFLLWLKSQNAGDIIGIKERLENKNGALYEKYKDINILTDAEINYEIKAVLNSGKYE